MDKFVKFTLWLSYILLCIISLVELMASPYAIQDTTELTTALDGRVQMPCNMTPKAKDDSVTIVLWYKSPNATGPPIYTIDLRTTPPTHHINENYKNRAHFDISSSPALMTLEPVRVNDTGWFSCRCDYKWSRTSSLNFLLNVIVPPRGMYIRDSLGQPVYAIGGPYDEDSELRLTCVVENGRPPPRVLWYLDDTVIDDSSAVRSVGSRAMNYSSLEKSLVNNSLESIVENELLIKRLTRRYFNSVLTCQAVNKHYGSVPVTASLRLDMNLKATQVKIGPTIGMDSLIAGRKVEFVCVSYGSKPAAKVIWTLGTKELTRTRTTHSTDGNSTSSSLVLVPTPEDDRELLRCRAENPMIPGHFIEDTFHLNVRYKPRLVLTLRNYSDKIAIKGKDVTFDCLVRANPLLMENHRNQIIWFFNKSPLTFEDSLRSGITLRNSSLLIKNLEPKKHEGSYHCMASNEEGTGTSNSIQLNVSYAPVCSEQSIGSSGTLFEVPLGESLAVKCSVDARPVNVSYQWTFEPFEYSRPVGSKSAGVPSSSSSLFDFENSSPVSKSLGLVTMVNGGLIGTVHFRPNSSSDYGLLHCRASNWAGNQTEPCTFQILPPLGPPSPPFECTISNQTTAAFQVDCKFDEGSERSENMLADRTSLVASSSSHPRISSTLASEHVLRSKVRTRTKSDITYQLDIYGDSGSEEETEGDSEQFSGEGRNVLNREHERQLIVSLEEQDRPSFRVSSGELRRRLDSSRGLRTSSNKVQNGPQNTMFTLVIYARSERGNSSFVETTLRLESLDSSVDSTSSKQNQVANYSSNSIPGATSSKRPSSSVVTSYESQHVLLVVIVSSVVLLFLLLVLLSQIARSRRLNSSNRTRTRKYSSTGGLANECRQGNFNDELQRGRASEQFEVGSCEHFEVPTTRLGTKVNSSISKADLMAVEFEGGLSPDVILSTDSLHVVIVKPRDESDYYEENKMSSFANGLGDGESEQVSSTMTFRIFSVSTPV